MGKTLERETLLAAAREVIGMQKYCALITLDSSGRPQVRTMNPFAPEDDMTVWIATNRRCRKVREIENDPRVSLYYADHTEARGYVQITGRAVLVHDMQEKLKRKRDYWDEAFPDWNDLVLIQVIPETIEVLNYGLDPCNDPQTWRTPSVSFEASG